MYIKYDYHIQRAIPKSYLFLKRAFRKTYFDRLFLTYLYPGGRELHVHLFMLSSNLNIYIVLLYINIYFLRFINIAIYF